MTTSTATKFEYTIYTPALEDLDGGAFMTTFESNELFTANDLIENIQKDETIKWAFKNEGEFSLAADGGWCVEMETENDYYELTPFGLCDLETIFEPSEMTLEEQKALRDEYEV